MRPRLSLTLPGKVLVIMGLVQSWAVAGIEGTAHDLSSSAPGQAGCTYCHTQHGMTAGPVLWNRRLSDVVYKIYQSTSLEAKVGQPTGSSKLCLSCHDGTVAPSGTSKANKPSRTFMAPGGANLGTDLSDDHPISFAYTSAIAARDPQIRSPETLPEHLLLDRSSEMQCTTCHNPHDDSFGKFLVMPNYQSLLCKSCHDLHGWEASVHSRSPASVSEAADTYLRGSQYTTMDENGCLCCHRPHAAGGHERLLHFEQSEDNCLSCHDGTVARTNLIPNLSSVSGHDVRRYDQIHDIKESVVSSARHVECVDCHNPHAVQKYPAEAPFASGVLTGVSGMTAAGSTVPQVRNEYEVCFKCHGDSPDRIDSPITRQITQTNTRLEFNLSNPSFHPVLAPGVNQEVPSLTSGMNEAVVIYCTDCHNSDPSSQVMGPHGSVFAALLAYNYQTEDQPEESVLAYELCYQCHSRNSILADESFSAHEKHLNDNISCAACHDPHGISSLQGSKLNNSHLINFDISVVAPDPVTGRLEFEDQGTFRGRCFLLCHEKNHSPLSYAP